VTAETVAAWQAPYAAQPVHATVRVPGSKSITNRALLLAAIADGPSTLTQPLLARDTLLMVDALTGLGVTIDDVGDAITVTPAPLRGPATVDCGLAGTVMRFVPPVAALAQGPVAFDGDPRSRERPLDTVLTALRTLGVDIDAAAQALPFVLTGRGSVPGGVVTIDASASSQFVSALLLAGARYDAGVDVRHDGKPVPSQPHIDLTVAMLRARGVQVDDGEPNRWQILPGPVKARDETVEPDLSNAAPFLAAAVVTAGSVTVPGWPRQTTQAGDALRDILTRFGAEVVLSDAGLTVSGGDAVQPVDVDLHDVGELTPVVAAIAALADGPSYLRGIAHLRGHETDRLAALTTELGNLGVAVTERPDALIVTPGRLAPALFRTYADHRMAQAAAVLGLRVRGLRVDDIATTTKTMADFPGLWAAMLG